MGQYREEVVRTSAEPDAAVVEQRTVQDDGTGRRVVETTTTTAPPAAIRSTRLVRRWWRPGRVVAGTEYVTAPGDAPDPSLARFLRIAWFLLGLVEAVLALRFVLSLLGANERNEFAAAVYALTG